MQICDKLTVEPRCRADIFKRSKTLCPQNRKLRKMTCWSVPPTSRSGKEFLRLRREVLQKKPVVLSSLFSASSPRWKTCVRKLSTMYAKNRFRKSFHLKNILIILRGRQSGCSIWRVTSRIFSSLFICLGIFMETSCSVLCPITRTTAKCLRK